MKNLNISCKTFTKRRPERVNVYLVELYCNKRVEFTYKMTVTRYDTVLSLQATPDAYNRIDVQRITYEWRVSTVEIFLKIWMIICTAHATKINSCGKLVTQEWFLKIITQRVLYEIMFIWYVVISNVFICPVPGGNRNRNFVCRNP